MRAIDTNVVVRFLTSDDAVQAAAARALVEAGDLFVATTVMLESEWVLRSAYDLPAREVSAALRAFAGLPGIRVEDPALLARALDWAERGMDFVDALHLGRAQGCESFMSFDRKLAAAAATLADIPVQQP